MGLVALSAASGCVGTGEDPNVAVFQPDIHGVRLSAIPDFTFHKDVYRARAQ